MSVEKAVAFEKTRNTGPAEGKNYRFIELPRARRVGQSYVSSVWTTVLSFRTAFRLLTLEPLRNGGRESWDFLLVNGPGTCVVAAVAVMLPRVSRLHLGARSSSPKLTCYDTYKVLRSVFTSSGLRRILGTGQIALSKRQDPQARRRQVCRSMG